MAVAAMLARTLFLRCAIAAMTKTLHWNNAGWRKLAPIILSVLAIVIGTLSNTSIAGLLIGGIPRLAFSGFVFLYTMVRVKLNPESARRC